MELEMKLLREHSKILAVVAGMLVAVFGLYLRSAWQRHAQTISPCVQSFACFWEISGASDSGTSSDSAKFAIGIHSKAIDDSLEALDALHGVLLDDDGREYESDDEYTPADVLLQNFVDALWRSGTMRAQGVFAIKSPMGSWPRWVMRELFSSDAVIANEILENHFPRVFEIVSDAPFADLSRREAIGRSVHHILTKVTVDDLFYFYDVVCAYEPLATICGSASGGSFGILNWLERIEAWTGLEASVDIDIYWTLRGTSIVWANRPEFLVDVLHETSAPDLNFSNVEKSDSSLPFPWREGMWINVLAVRATVSETISVASELSRKEKSYSGFLAFPDLGERMEQLRESFSAGVRVEALMAEFYANPSAVALKVAVAGNGGGAAEARVFAQSVLRQAIPELGVVQESLLRELPTANTDGVDVWKGVVWRGLFTGLPPSAVSRFSGGLPEESGVLMDSVLTW
jgi:hypothetical protein